MENEERIIERLDIIIELLTRKIYNPEEAADLVTKGRKNPNAYKRGFNNLDGEHTVTSIAKIAGVSKPTMSVAIKSWEKAGIVVNIGTIGKPRYKKLLTLP